MSLETPLSPETESTKKRHRMNLPIPSSVEIVDVESFCFTPISQKGTDKSTAISVEQYSLDRDLHHAIAASLGLQTPTLIDLSNSDDENDDVAILNSKPQNTPLRKRRRNPEKGESSNSNNSNTTTAAATATSAAAAVPFVCEICTETKTLNDSFQITGCTHSYCKDCVVMYVASKLQENVINIRCPVTECVGGLLEAEGCREILPKEVFDRWGNASCEAVILATEKFYCPYKDCSALLIDDGEEVVKECECPNCRRLFCAQCKVPWHDGMECEEFQKLNQDEREMEDIMLMQLANSKKWRRCPHCGIYVEKTQGCMYMKCRCGHAFCYNCGSLPKNNSHYCFACRR